MEAKDVGQSGEIGATIPDDGNGVVRHAQMGGDVSQTVEQKHTCGGSGTSDGDESQLVIESGCGKGISKAGETGCEAVAVGGEASAE